MFTAEFMQAMRQALDRAERLAERAKILLRV